MKYEETPICASVERWRMDTGEQHHTNRSEANWDLRCDHDPELWPCVRTGFRFLSALRHSPKYLVSVPHTLHP